MKITPRNKQTHQFVFPVPVAILITKRNQSSENIPTETGTDVFQYYFAQREAVETIIYLYEVAGAKDKL